MTYPVQVNGKVRGRIEVAADAAEDAVRAAALAEVADAAGRQDPEEGHRRAGPHGHDRRLNTCRSRSAPPFGDLGRSVSDR